MDYQEYQLGEVREAMENKQREDRYDEWITYDVDWLCDMSTSRHMNDEEWAHHLEELIVRLNAHLEGEANR